MKLKVEEKNGKPIFQTVTWGDHYGSCRHCERVDLEKTSTFAFACAMGSALLSEEAINKWRPQQKEKDKRVREWAKSTGVFKGIYIHYSLLDY